VLSALAAPPQTPVARLVQEASSRPIITLDDCVLDDPDEDVSLFTDPVCDNDEDVPSASALPKAPPKVIKSGKSKSCQDYVAKERSKRKVVP
jgi:hypothetical protein